MAHPVLFCVHDEPTVLEALTRDLARRLGSGYRIVGDATPATALATPQQLARRSDDVAAVIAAQRMTRMPECRLPSTDPSGQSAVT